jgi:cytochrome P450
MASASSSLFVPNTVGVSARGASSRPRVNGVSMPPRSRHTRVRRLAIASAPSDAGDGVGAYAVADTSEQRARGAAVCDEEFDTTTTTAVNLETSKESTDCPYTSLNASLGGILPTKSKVPIGGPTMLDNSVFFKSLLKAGSSPVGMPEAMLEWCDLTGQETVGIKNLVGPLCVSTIDPDIVEYVCHTNAKNYKLRMLPDAFRYVIKNKGITGSDGRYNREHRRMCQKPFMNSFSLEQFSGRVEERVGALLDAWETNCETNGGDALAVDIDDHSQKLTLDIVTSLAFNKDFKQVEGINASLNGGKAPDETIITKVLDAYNTTSQIMGELFITPVPILKLQNFLGIGRVRELKEGYKILEQNGVHIIEERRTQLAANAEKGDTQDYCLLDSLLRATDENGNPLPQDEVWGDVNDIMAAGHRTTASNLTVNLHHLARMPEIQQKVAEEVRGLKGKAPTFKDVQEGKLPYTQRVVKESLRKYAPINLFPRLVEAPDVLPSGHKVKPGDFILLSSWAMGRNPRVWESPDTFDPDRFTEENLRANAERLALQSAGPNADRKEIELQMDRATARISSGRDFTYTPFGSGPRSCIGGTFALLATTVNLASMVQRFEFETDPTKDPGFELPFFYDTTITFPLGAPLRGLRPEV